MYKIVITLASVITIISCNPKVESKTSLKKQEHSIKVVTEIVSKNKNNTHMNYTGVITPYSTTPLGFQLPGLVKNIYVKEGDVIKKGQILASINNETYQSTYAIAKASQEQAQDAYERLKKVHDQGSLPEIQWQEMNTNLTKANASAAIALQNLKRCNIIAPVNGTIGKRDLEIGATTTPGVSVFDLMTIKNVYVRISVPETEINKIKSGQIAEITIPAISYQKLSATVQNIGVVANQFSKTYEVKLIMNNPNQIIKPGMACDIDLITNTMSNHIAIPYSAVIQEENKKNYVYTVNKSNNKVSKQLVDIGLFSNNEIIIINGLSEGDFIVVTGHQKLHDQSTITF
ncbi:efflux RND transporter periplasmic adaptor subunit [Flavicella sp.]|uniref:efflux RND transporter periplasmic adaptor subunit n=1 Tax=Flavicella sp. TaxID=2957742 RepID=UPI003017B332